MKTISLMFPEQDNNEIYAYLEAHHNNPNRIQLVTEELLRMQGVNYTQDSLIDLTLESQDSNNAESHVKDTGRGKSSPTVTTVSDILDRDINTLLAIFIDSDPLFLRKELEQMGNAHQTGFNCSVLQCSKEDMQNYVIGSKKKKSRQIDRGFSFLFLILRSSCKCFQNRKNISTMKKWPLVRVIRTMQTFNCRTNLIASVSTSYGANFSSIDRTMHQRIAV